ncbi:MAG: 5-oxoprolinase subunit PxpB [Pseudomonadota bacterium]
MTESNQSNSCFDQPRFLTAGDTVLMVQLGNKIDEQLSNAVLSLDANLSEASPDGLIEIVPSYTGLSISYDPLRLAPDRLKALVLDLVESEAANALCGRRWVLPTAYGGKFGQDLDPIAERHGMTADEVVRRHSTVSYRVYMLGFMPGFAFMGGLSPELATERLASPRPLVPAGSVGIGGAQTGIFSIAAPSGWHMLGRSPVRVFDPRRDEPFLLGAGDHVRFEPIDHNDWEALDQRASEGDPLVAPLT